MSGSWNARATDVTYVNGYFAKTKIVFTTPVARSVIGLAPYDLYIRVENGASLGKNTADIGWDPASKTVYVPTFWKNAVIAFEVVEELK